MNTFTEQYKRIYSVRQWTFQHFYCMFVYFVIFALPFYFCFASKNFWFDPQYALMQVDYQYTGYYAVQVNYANAQPQEYAVFPSSNINTGGNPISNPEISDTVNLTNFTFTIDGQYASINMLIFYNVKVAGLNKMASSSFAVSMMGGTSKVTGKLQFQVSKPFNALTSLSTYTINRPAYFDVNYRAPTSFFELMVAHLENEYKLQAETYAEFKAAPTVVSVQLVKNRQVVLGYIPSILQTFKLKFSTYFGMLFLSYLIFYNLMLRLARGEALECNQRDEIPRKTVRNT